MHPHGVLVVHVTKKSEEPGLNAALVAGVAVREQKKLTFEQTSLFNNFISLKIKCLVYVREVDGLENSAVH